jgi:hypothetical protein
MEKDFTPILQPNLLQHTYILSVLGAFIFIQD